MTELFEEEDDQPFGPTLAEARQQIENGGEQCPCCGQLVRSYKRKLHAQMAAWLCSLVRQAGPGGRWVSIDELPARGGDYGKLVHWGLVEQKAKTPEDTKRRTSGLWRPTLRGYQWVRNELSVPKYAEVRLGQLVQLTGEYISITDALGTHFDYAELMWGV